MLEYVGFDLINQFTLRYIKSQKFGLYLLQSKFYKLHLLSSSLFVIDNPIVMSLANTITHSRQIATESKNKRSECATCNVNARRSSWTTWNYPISILAPNWYPFIESKGWWKLTCDILGCNTQVWGQNISANIDQSNIAA